MNGASGSSRRLVPALVAGAPGGGDRYGEGQTLNNLGFNYA